MVTKLYRGRYSSPAASASKAIDLSSGQSLWVVSAIPGIPVWKGKMPALLDHKWKSFEECLMDTNFCKQLNSLGGYLGPLMCLNDSTCILSFKKTAQSRTDYLNILCHLKRGDCSLFFKYNITTAWNAPTQRSVKYIV